MRRLVLALTVAIAVTISGSPASAGSPYTVTLKVEGDAGVINKDKVIRLYGKVSPGAAGSKVTVQRKRLGKDSSFKTIGQPTLTSKSKYSFKVKAGYAGEVLYRVKKSGTGSHAKGTSTTLHTYVFRWRNVSSLPIAGGNGNFFVTLSGQIKGSFFSPYMTMQGNSGAEGYRAYVLDDRCTRLTGYAALLSPENADATAYMSLYGSTPENSGSYVEEVAELNPHRNTYPHYVQGSVSGIQNLQVLANGLVAGDTAVWASLKVYCAS